MLGKKKDKVAASKALLDKIPFDHVYEESGIIEANGRFTRMYLVCDVKPENAEGYDPMIEEQKVTALLNAFPPDVSFQFVSHNELIDMDDYLKKILVKSDDDVTKLYNRVVYNMSDIGHNNIKKVTYLILAIKADVIDDALARFKKLDQIVVQKFADIYKLEVKAFSAAARLKVIYSMLNPEKKGFGAALDLKGDGRIDLKNLKFMKLTAKDLVAPASWKLGEMSGKILNPFVDYSILNAGTNDEHYMRTFFINSVPKVVSPNMISDFTNISSNMVLSITYEPIDSKLGLETVSQKVKDNTQVVIKSKTDTIEDRKNHATSTIKRIKDETEMAYFEQTALDLLKISVASERRAFKCTMTAVIYAPAKELLDRDSKLLKLSAAKFAASVKPLDYQQKEGLQSSLPLCAPKIDVARILDSDRLAVMTPINIRDVVKRGGLYYGLNAINGNLIMLNRKNMSNYNGVIAGSEHIGKTFQNKREIVNAFIGSRDRITIVATNDEYDELVEKLGGQIIEKPSFDIFETEKGYALTEDDYAFKAYAIDAIVTSLQDLKDFRKTSDDDGNSIGDRVEKETAMLFRVAKGRSGKEIKAYVDNHGKNFPLIKKALSRLDPRFLETPLVTDERDPEKRVFLYKAENATDILCYMDRFWNLCIKDKKRNMSSWFFIDSIDECLRRIQGSEYIFEFMVKADLLKTVFTVVIQESASLVASADTAAALDSVMGGCGYVKLLNLGPNERRRFCEKLNIPNTLIQYVANVGLGRGLIITPSSNSPFEDSFLQEDEEFKQLFAKDIEQIRFDELR